MARVFIDGFESGSTDLWEVVVGSGLEIQASYAPFGDGAYYARSYSGTASRRMLPLASSYYVAMKVSAGNTSPFLLFQNENSVDLFNLSKNANGFIQGALGSNNASPIVTGTTYIATSTSFDLEVYYKPSTSTDGRFIVKINGVIQFDFTGITSPQSGGIQYIKLTGGGSTTEERFDNIVVDNTDWPGITRIQALKIDTNGSNYQFLPSLGLVTGPSSNRWRFMCTSGSSSYVSVQELEMHGVIGGSDLCNGGTATAGGGTLSGVASNVFDGLATTWLRWNYTGADWVEYQFASPVSIVEFVVTVPTVAQIGTASYYPKTIQFQYYDGANWITVGTFPVTFSDGEKKIFNNTTLRMVKEIPYDDSTYARTSDSDTVDSFVMSDFVPPQVDVPWKIKSMQVQARACFEGVSGANNLELLIKPSTITYESAQKALTTRFNSVANLWEVNPDTGLPWTVTELNALEAGYKSKL